MLGRGTDAHGRPLRLPATVEQAGRSAAVEATERLFVGVQPPSEVASVIASLERPALASLRWTTPEQWHVTLAFLGNVPVSTVGPLRAALAAAAARVVARPEARLGPVTQRVGRSILCVPVAGLDDLAATVQRALQELLPDIGGAGAFHGHLTLARARGRQAVPASMAGAPIEARWQVGEVDLVRSALDPSGARHTTLLRATLPS